MAGNPWHDAEGKFTSKDSALGSYQDAIEVAVKNNDPDEAKKLRDERDEMIMDADPESPAGQHLLKKAYGSFKSSFKKSSDTSREHIRSADKKINSMKKDLDARDSRISTYQQITSTIPESELKELSELKTNTRQAGLGHLNKKDNNGNPIIGISYQGDHRYEEESGLHHISTSLKEGKYAPDDVLYQEKDGKGFLIIKGEESFSFNEEKWYEQNKDIAEKRFDQYVPFEDLNKKWDLERKSVQELRGQLKGKVKPLPTTKDALVQAALQEQKSDDEKQKIKTPQGEFNNGKALVIASDNEAMKTMMRKSKEAHDNGSLRVGSSSNPFSRGVLFYDDRDISKKDKINEIREEEAAKFAVKNIQPTVSKLKDEGFSVYATSPTVSADTQDTNDVEYFLNSTVPAKYSSELKANGISDRSLYGRFKKDDLDKFAQGDFTPYYRKYSRKAPESLV